VFSRDQDDIDAKTPVLARTPDFDTAVEAVIRDAAAPLVDIPQ
jgi:hypothetical protein